MLKCGTKLFLPCHMNSILVEAWDAFKVSTSNIIRDRFVKINLPPLILSDFTTNSQACDASIQVSSGSKAEEINNISFQTVGPIEVKITRTDDHMFVLRAKGTQQSSRNIIIGDAAYDSVRKLRGIPIR